ncbi:MAG: hypothetical protein AUJ75_04045 [Candidatus Omnitrophica bacterium CG1_02_49_10]|nr:MAG: hypothetical protein AUJ75_04045 [Candidatus Omnitrophica bacterium CG1_02_49_10]
MIKIDITTAVFLYLAVWIVGFFVVWIFVDKDRGKRSYGHDERYIWQCSICTKVYVDSKNDMFSVCPACGSYNKRDVPLVL